LSNKKNVYGEPTSQEALILAEKFEPDAVKSDEEEKDPKITEPSDQVSDQKPETIIPTPRSPLIEWIYKQNMSDLFGYAPEYEHMLLAIFVCQPAEADKCDEGEKFPEEMEPPDQASDPGCLPEVIPTLRSPPTNPVPEIKIGPINQCPKELILAECGTEQEVEEVRREEDKVSDRENPYVKHPQEAKDFPQSEKSDEGEKSPEEMKPPDPASDPGCLPEVIPTLRSPPTNPVPEIKIGPIYQYPKELKLAECGAEQEGEEAREEGKLWGSEKTEVKHHQEDKDPQSENLPSKNQAKKKKIPFKGFKPLPENYIPIYPCLKDLLAELGSQEAQNEDKKISGYEKADAKNEVQESPEKSLIQSDSPQNIKSENIKDKIIKKKITLKVIHPTSLPHKDWYFSLQIKEGSVEKEQIKIKHKKTSKNQLTWTPLIFYVGKDDVIVFNIMEKRVSFGSMSRVIASGQWTPDNLKNRKFTSTMSVFRSVIPDLKVEIEAEDILETIEKPDSGQNKRQQKINQSFLKNEFLHLKERFKKRRFSE
jgi:hypothetical protein